ncbi:MAG: RNA 2',3'-cyclic phosphodiesterase [Syntrophomonadaceae bacterium]|nr:RNA 2',3'-cyclic phosphodiesterase [Syntrophomonadaceae bacterium]
MRTFIAIPIPQDIREMAADVRNSLEKTGADVKWVEEENYHITLKFLGDIDQQIANNIYIHLNSISENYHSFVLKVRGIGFFPNANQPRVIWLGVNGELEKANLLGERIDAHLTEEGFEPERKRSFHLTLGRIRSKRGQKELLDETNKLNKIIKSRSFLVNKIDFMESRLTPQGPNYILHKSFWLRD